MNDLNKFLSSCTDQELESYAIKVRENEYATVSSNPIEYRRWDNIGTLVRAEVRRRGDAISPEDLIAMLIA
jgi:hypothetical protein